MARRRSQLVAPLRENTDAFQMLCHLMMIRNFSTSNILASGFGQEVMVARMTGAILG